MTFLTLYHGDDPKRAQMIATSINPELIRKTIAAMLEESQSRSHGDPVLESLERGRRVALLALLDLMVEQEKVA